MHRDGGSLSEFHITIPNSLTSVHVHWFCLHTKPLKEAQVASYCTTQLGLEAYFPRLRQSKVIRRKRRFVIRPLFPRYLFCRFDPALLYRAVRYAPDMLDIVSNGSTPAVVADGLIENLQEWAGNEIDILTLQPGLRVGDHVEVTGGPLQGLSGTILKESEDRARVTILLTFLQNGSQLSVDRSELRRIA